MSHIVSIGRNLHIVFVRTVRLFSDYVTSIVNKAIRLRQISLRNRCKKIHVVSIQIDQSPHDVSEEVHNERRRKVCSMTVDNETLDHYQGLEVSVRKRLPKYLKMYSTMLMLLVN